LVDGLRRASREPGSRSPDAPARLDPSGGRPIVRAHDTGDTVVMARGSRGRSSIATAEWRSPNAWDGHAKTLKVSDDDATTRGIGAITPDRRRPAGAAGS